MSSSLAQLEAESIYIFREVVAELDNVVMLYSIGKDSSVLLHLAQKAFYPSKIPFPLLHIDTTWKFAEMIQFRESLKEKYGLDLKAYTNMKGVEAGLTPFDNAEHYTRTMKTEALKQALKKFDYRVAFGGARRDEEKSRAKERIYSFRDKYSAWEPRNQRPELWSLYNGLTHPDESVRIFPLSNWTELDIWQYIKQEDIPIVSLYYAKKRPVVRRNGLLLMQDDDRLQLDANEKIENLMVRFRTLGCYPLTGAIESEATTIDGIIEEMEASHYSERQGRVIDKDSSFAMEKKKREGYF